VKSVASSVANPNATSDPVPLSRNRDFLLLQAGQVLSASGSQATTIAYPLLVLAVTHSPVKAGIVTSARTIPVALFALIAGVAADRWSRRRLMIAADVVRALAISSLVVAILLDRLSFWQIPIVAFVEGMASTFFGPAGAGALRSVVPPRQLPAAAGIGEVQSATLRLAGPPTGAALFGLGHAVPFLADAVSYGFSTISLTMMRTPFQEVREVATARLRSRIAEGFRYLWRQPFLRTCALLWGLGNFSGPGLLLVVIVVGKRQGLSSGAVGLLISAFGASILIGSLASPLFRRSLATRTILLLEMWTWLGCGLFLMWPSVYVLIAGMLPSGIVIPVSDSVVTGYRIAVTPDRLVGRVESVRSTLSLLIAPLGPLAAGFLLGSTSTRTTVAVFTLFGLVLALSGTLSTAIRNAPSLDDLENLSRPAVVATGD
jgi:predicted MFS family arabinose efflux permease